MQVCFKIHTLLKFAAQLSSAPSERHTKMHILGENEQKRLFILKNGGET